MGCSSQRIFTYRGAAQEPPTSLKKRVDPKASGPRGRRGSLEFTLVLATAFGASPSICTGWRTLAIRSLAILALPSRITSAALILASSNALTALMSVRSARPKRRTCGQLVGNGRMVNTWQTSCAISWPQPSGVATAWKVRAWPADAPSVSCQARHRPVNCGL